MKKKLTFYTVLALFTFLIYSCQSDTFEDSSDLYQTNDIELNAAKSSSVMPKGFNAHGFNWNAHHFNGILLNVFFSDTMFDGYPFYGMEPYTGDDDAYLEKYPFADQLPFWHYRHIDLVMHWNEALISRDGVYPATWINSNGFITFHYSGTNNGSHWSQFQKMVAARDSDYFLAGKWYNEKDEEIGVASGYLDLIMISIKNTGPTPFFFYPEYHNPISSGIGKYKIH